MKKKQSSVEWYANASHELIVKKSNGEITEREFLTMHHNLFYDAEAMHKEEMFEYIKQKYCIGRMSLEFHTLEFEQYYNETFGGNNE